MEDNVTKVSSRGQVVIPKVIRRSLGLQKGTGLLVFKIGDSIVLKSPGIAPDKAVETNLKAIRKKIRRLGITREDVEAEIKQLRRSRKKATI